jgi:hypothetical protein
MHNCMEVLVKYRILALLDRLTGHRLHGICGWVWDYEMHLGIDWDDIETTTEGILITDGYRTLYWDAKTETATLSE